MALQGKSKRKYKNIELLFVVHALNYKDMPSFVRIAKSTTFTQHSQATAIGVPDILIKMRLFLSLGMKKNIMIYAVYYLIKFLILNFAVWIIFYAESKNQI